MKNARDRAKHALMTIKPDFDSIDLEYLTTEFVAQDRQTSHACAEAINEMKDDHDGNVDKIDAFRLCMSVKSV